MTLQLVICIANIYNLLPTYTKLALNFQSPLLPGFPISQPQPSLWPSRMQEPQESQGADWRVQGPPPKGSSGQCDAGPTRLGDQSAYKDEIMQQMYLQGEEFLFSFKKQSLTKALLSLGFK